MEEKEFKMLKISIRDKILDLEKVGTSKEDIKKAMQEVLSEY